MPNRLGRDLGIDHGTMEPVLAQQCGYCGADSNGAMYCCEGCERLDGAIDSRVEDSFEFASLDFPNIKSRYHFAHGPFDYRLHVEGLHCASCVHLIEKLPDFNVGVAEARVDFAASSLAIKVESDFSLARLLQLLKSWGYVAHFLAIDENPRAKIAEENKALLKKLAITGFCAGNIMLFVIPIYAGLEGSWKIAFNWMSFLLFLPVVFYSGLPFYQGAWNSLRYRIVNVDLPITVALLSGFLLSLVNLVRGDGAVYFDSTAGFVFLIICARYYLKTAQQKFVSGQPLGNEILNDQYHLIHEIPSIGPIESTVTAQEIGVGSKLCLRKGQTCPVDGVLETAALIDLGVLNGEPLPRRFESGMRILAGSRALSDQVEVRATAAYEATYLFSLLQELRGRELGKSNFTSLSDRAAQWLITIVSLTAALYFVLNFQNGFQEAFNRSLALIVLACPCALAFGAPLTLHLALRRAQALGILIKDSGTLEKVWGLKKVFFDKTGTLTSLNLKVTRTEPCVLKPEVVRIILGLERTSYHPIAFAIRDWARHSNLAIVTEVEEKLGIGVSGHSGGSFYELVQNANDHEANRGPSVALLKDGKKIASIFFGAPLDAEARATIHQLEKNGIECLLASGDLKSKVQAVAAECGLPAKRVFGGLTPHEKRELVTQSSAAAMIGDGSNDALALQAAAVGIAMKGSTYVNLQAADVYFTREGLKPLLDLFSLARLTRRVLVRNLVFALIYNLTGGVLALLGHVDPWLAAVLMPASSFLIISSTLWGFR